MQKYRQNQYGNQSQAGESTNRISDTKPTKKREKSKLRIGNESTHDN